MVENTNKTYRPTPTTTLEEHIMDCNIPKNEAEWWARKEIKHLRKQIAELEANAEPHNMPSGLVHKTYHQMVVEKLESQVSELKTFTDELIQIADEESVKNIILKYK